jgi:flavin-dependent dehydrogenase
LDDWLLAQARSCGVEIHLDTAVEALNCESGEIRTNRGTFSANQVLGADGRNSFSARAAGLSAPAKRCNRIAWQTTLSIQDDLGTLDNHVHLRIFPEGYYGLVRINSSQANLCFVLDCKSPERVNDVAARYFPNLGEPGWRTVNPISRGHAVLGKQKLWLVGDAARVVEPFTGEGIYFALATAEMAANSLIAGETLPQYTRRHHALYRSRVWVNDLVRLALLRPKRALFFCRILRHVPGVLRLASEQIHQRAPQPVIS